jgi:hypothetical protein
VNLTEFIERWLLFHRLQVTVSRRPVVAMQELLSVRDLGIIMSVLIAHDGENLLHIQQPLVVLSKVLAA